MRYLGWQAKCVTSAGRHFGLQLRESSIGCRSVRLVRDLAGRRVGQHHLLPGEIFLPHVGKLLRAGEAGERQNVHRYEAQHYEAAFHPNRAHGYVFFGACFAGAVWTGAR